ncbi:MAG: hypothetical protein WDO13_14565 [Verrucomicrobiota bacterium]
MRPARTADEYPSLPREKIHPAWEKKRSLLSAGTGSRLVLAANSHWIQKRIEVLADAWSAPAASPSRTSLRIRFGVSLDVFRPQDKKTCREILGLPQDKFILFFCCSNLSDKRKA